MVVAAVNLWILHLLYKPYLTIFHHRDHSLQPWPRRPLQGGHLPVRIKFPDFSRYFKLHLRSYTDCPYIIHTNGNKKTQLFQQWLSTYWKEPHI